ncbi:CBS domain protein [Roseiarcus fermentans]|uniref:CBS domain protein n=1 Tax=Roseiarcus fermentans TaxID=1473586 RepID=A0A366FQE4_9HYPH|nr:CBS domain-containing protein [Roseiarcus fermentans]RBP16872.1 CBS domain protein [Roseiarcus fermentans]
MRVREVMTHGAIGLPETATIAEAAETMLKARISAVLVHDANNALVGVVSSGDLMRRAEIGAERKRPRWIEALLSGGRLAESYAHSHGRKIGEIMTRRLVCVSEDAELGAAVDLMLRHGVKRLPVLRGEAVIGILSRTDLMKALVKALPASQERRSDTEIKAAIEAELDRLGWAPRRSVRVEARDGVVTFGGAITDERLREGLRVIAENTPGVTKVHDQMCWIEPNSGVYLPAEEEEGARPKS